MLSRRIFNPAVPKNDSFTATCVQTRIQTLKRHAATPSFCRPSLPSPRVRSFTLRNNNNNKKVEGERPYDPLGYATLLLFCLFCFISACRGCACSALFSLSLSLSLSENQRVLYTNSSTIRRSIKRAAESDVGMLLLLYVVETFVVPSSTTTVISGLFCLFVCL